jgi:hypothetical protein
MLRDIYISTGSVGTFLIAVGMFVTFIVWWMAVTETVTREGLSNTWRAALVLFMSLLPPTGVLVTALYIRSDRRAVSRSLKAHRMAEATEKSPLHLSMKSSTGKAA